MIKSKYNYFLIFYTIMSFKLCVMAQSKKVIAHVHVTNQNGIYVYNYNFKNNYNSAIWMINLGQKLLMDPTLDAEPTKIISPKSWTGESAWLEDSDPARFLVTWKQPELDKLKNDLILPGELKDGFKIVLKNKSESFIRCYYTVSFVDGTEYYNFIDVK